MRRLLVVLAAVSLLFAPPHGAEAAGRERAPARTRNAGHVNGYPCGGRGRGSLPPCYVMWRESRGNPVAQNRRSTASGLWQFVDGTWRRHGGYRKARHAPWLVQNQRASIVWNDGRGCRHWGRVACRIR